MDFYYDKARELIKKDEIAGARKCLIGAMRAQPLDARVPLLLLSLDLNEKKFEEFESYFFYMYELIRNYNEFVGKTDEEIDEALRKLFEEITR